MEKSRLYKWFLILFAGACFGALGDIRLDNDGNKVIWKNNGETFSIAASPSMSESINYIWAPKDGTGGQALLTDGSGVLSFGVPSTSAAHDILSVTHDAVADTVTRGSLIYGNATPKWDELTVGAALGGAATGFLGHDGTDVGNRTLAQVLADLSGDAAAAFSWNDQGLTNVGYMQFDTATAFSGGNEGDVWWNSTDHGLNLDSGIGPVAQVPFEIWINAKNETGLQIDDGMVVFINGSSSGRPTISLAKADLPLTSDRTIGIATMDIPDGTVGIVATFGEVRDIDTAGCTAGNQIYLSAATAGFFTDVQPSYPNFIIKIGSCEIEDAVNGKVLVNVSGRIEDIIENAWNGVTIQSFDARTSSDGATVTMSLEKSGGGDIFLNFSDGLTVLDCTPSPCTIELTAGTDNSPQVNYIYIPQSTKVLTKSTSNFPFGTEHIKIGFFFVSSATKAAADDGVLINQNWNDHIAGSDGQGHTTHLGEQNRYNKGYFSGLDANGTDQSAATSYFNFIGATEAYFKATSGVMYQLHRHVMTAIDTQTGDDIHVANWFGDNYHEINNIADIVADSTGASLSNSYFNVFFFDVGNKTGEYTPLIAVVPGGSYSTEGSAINDVDRFNNTTMPREFGLDSSVGVPVCLMTMRWSGGLTTLSHIATEDFRQGGGTGSLGAGGTTDFADNQFDIFDSDDITRVINFDAGSITTGNTKTITMADADVDLADIALNNTYRGVGHLPLAGGTLTGDLLLSTQNQKIDMSGSIPSSGATSLIKLSTNCLGGGECSGFTKFPDGNTRLVIANDDTPNVCIFLGRSTVDAFGRWIIDRDGTMSWGIGSGSPVFLTALEYDATVQGLKLSGPHDNLDVGGDLDVGGELTVVGAIMGDGLDLGGGDITSVDTISCETIDVGGGFSGSWVNAEGDTVTVTNGIITNVAP